MNHTLQFVNAFFSEYETEFNIALHGAPDAETTASLFAECFVEANPSGVSCGKNDKEFRKAIPQRYAVYKNAGITEMKIISQDITLLNDIHALDRVKWRAFCETKDGKKMEAEFETIYLVHINNGEPKIFAYITGDEQKTFKEKGLTINSIYETSN